MWLQRAGADFWYFLRNYTWWWVTPILVILAIIAVLAATTDDPEVVPFIYTVK